jgi:hypothetical protein
MAAAGGPVSLLPRLIMSAIPENLESLDPGRRYLKKLRLRIKVWCFVLAMTIVAVTFLGLPFVQGDYTFRGPRSREGFVPADQKLSAWYLGVTGWREFYAIERQDQRLPVVLFVPVSEVLQFEPSFPYLRLREQ